MPRFMTDSWLDRFRFWAVSSQSDRLYQRCYAAAPGWGQRLLTRVFFPRPWMTDAQEVRFDRLREIQASWSEKHPSLADSGHGKFDTGLANHAKRMGEINRWPTNEIN